MFDPKTKKFPFPKDTASHYITIKKNNGAVFGADYPYIDKSRGMRVKQALTRFLLHVIVFPAARVRLGLRIKGRENLKKHREELQKGAITCSNHVHFWDFIAIMCAVRPYKPYVVTWAPNIRGENGKMIRLVGGIPIPEGSAHATFAYLNAVKDMLAGGGWLHIYAEGSMWEYYAPVRPFKRGPGFFATLCDKPIIPIGFS